MIPQVHMHSKLLSDGLLLCLHWTVAGTDKDVTIAQSHFVTYFTNEQRGHGGRMFCMLLLCAVAVVQN